MEKVSQDFERYGGSYLLSDKNYELHVNGKNEIGRPDGQFMAPSNQMDELLAKYPDNPREWEQQLGLGTNSLGDNNIHRVDVYNPHDYEPRLPTRDLSGANDKFIEGGRTPGGQDECVINRFPNPESNPSVGKVSTIEPGNNFSQASNNPQMNFSNTDSITGGSQAPPERTLGGNGSVNPSDCDISIPKTNAANPDAASSVDPVSSSVNKGINF